MRPRVLASAGSLMFAVAVLALSASLLGGQAPTSTARKAAAADGAPFRTPWGDPDLNGVWNNASGTPLERPAVFEGRAFLTDDELAEAERQLREGTSADRRDGAATDDLRREHNEFWFAKRAAILGRRTSLITDPPDGKLPPLTPEAARTPVPKADDFRGTDSWEDRGFNERCIVGLQNGPPILALPGPINVQLAGHMWHFQIVQTPGSVVILSEYIQQVRVIPLDGRPHLPQRIRQWIGDSRGHWEGRTLVVETTNFHEKRLLLGRTTEHLHLVERFTRDNADTIDYQFTVDDPTTWTRPWTAAVVIAKTDGRIFEFACHEGNYGLRNILSVARAQERLSAEAAK